MSFLLLSLPTKRSGKSSHGKSRESGRKGALPAATLPYVVMRLIRRAPMRFRVFRPAVLGLAVLACTGLSVPAQADKGGHGKSHEKIYEGRDRGGWDQDDEGRQGRHDTQSVIVIGPRDRTVIREYVSGDYRRHCPPGLAKKRNGCLPPGQAKKYRVGERLPRDVVYYPVPRDLLAELAPVPSGYEYVRVDKDILLIGEATKKVIDAVTLFSAVGQ